MSKTDTPDYDRHEILHMSSFLMGAVASELMMHKAITQDPEWTKHATAAHEALFQLYQSIGKEHLA